MTTSKDTDDASHEEQESFIVYYTKPPPSAQYVAGRLVDEALFRKVSPALAVDAFTQHQALHDAEQAVAIRVVNARKQQQSSPFSLHQDGFALVNLENDLAHHMAHTRARTSRDVAIPHAETLVRTACPTCTTAVAFDVTYRNSARNNRNSTLGPGGLLSSDSAAVGRVHADFTPSSARAKIRTLFHENPRVQTALAKRGIHNDNLPSHHLAIINVWRPLGPSGTVVQHKPLGLLHPASVGPREPFPYKLVYQNQAGTNASLSYNPTTKSSSSSSHHHQWYYYKDMTPQEALLFYNFHQPKQTTATNDNDPVGVAPAGTFHAALHTHADVDGYPDDSSFPPPRESVEVRVLVHWEE